MPRTYYGGELPDYYIVDSDSHVDETKVRTLAPVPTGTPALRAPQIHRQQLERPRRSRPRQRR